MGTPMSIYLRTDAEKALAYLLEHEYGGALDKRNAAIQQAIIALAKRKGMK